VAHGLLGYESDVEGLKHPDRAAAHDVVMAELVVDLIVEGADLCLRPLDVGGEGGLPDERREVVLQDGELAAGLLLFLTDVGDLLTDHGDGLVQGRDHALHLADLVAKDVVIVGHGDPNL
jgi:hypothetical protein